MKWFNYAFLNKNFIKIKNTVLDNNENVEALYIYG